MAFEPAEGVDDPVAMRPGGALLPSAVNYVRRAADDEAQDILLARRAPSSIVTAPLSGGTSSLLNRVFEQARTLPDCCAYLVHMDSFAGGADTSTDDLFRHVLHQIEVPMEILSDLSADNMKEAFKAWAFDAWDGLTRVVLIIDGLHYMFKNSGSQREVLALVNWLGDLRNETAKGPPFNKLISFTGFVGKTWSSAHSSPHATQAGLLELKKFSKPQIAKLFEHLGIGKGLYNLHDVFSLFHGHPYLTQIFAWSIRDGASPGEAKAAALSMAGSYEAHWERMKGEIRSLRNGEHDLNRIFALVRQKTRFESPHVHNKGRGTLRILNPEKIWDEQEYGRNLRNLGLLDQRPDNELLICDFYNNAIDREG